MSTLRVTFFLLNQHSISSLHPSPRSFKDVSAHFLSLRHRVLRTSVFCRLWRNCSTHAAQFGVGERRARELRRHWVHRSWLRRLRTSGFRSLELDISVSGPSSLGLSFPRRSSVGGAFVQVESRTSLARVWSVRGVYDVCPLSSLTGSRKNPARTVWWCHELVLRQFLGCGGSG